MNFWRFLRILYNVLKLGKKYSMSADAVKHIKFLKLCTREADIKKFLTN